MFPNQDVIAGKGRTFFNRALKSGETGGASLLNKLRSWQKLLAVAMTAHSCAIPNSPAVIGSPIFNLGLLVGLYGGVTEDGISYG